MSMHPRFFIACYEKQIVTDSCGSPLLLTRDQLVINELKTFFIAQNQEAEYHIIDLDDLSRLTFEYSLNPLRQLVGRTTELLWYIVSRGTQLVEWHQSNRFCSCCGAVTQLHTTDNVIECPKCNHQSYPQINPCIMVLIERGSQILLAQSARHSSSHYSLIAGFIEAGESVEEAIHREVFEEVGLHIKNLRYVISQSWPFPHSLMLGFIADYDCGEFNIALDEIADAQWFDLHELSNLKLPDQGTLSRKLIGMWCESQKNN